LKLRAVALVLCVAGCASDPPPAERSEPATESRPAAASPAQDAQVAQHAGEPESARVILRDEFVRYTDAGLELKGRTLALVEHPSKELLHRLVTLKAGEAVLVEVEEEKVRSVFRASGPRLALLDSLRPGERVRFHTLRHPGWFRGKVLEVTKEALTISPRVPGQKAVYQGRLSVRRGDLLEVERDER
jgi:hypothetical protein